MHDPGCLSRCESTTRRFGGKVEFYHSASRLRSATYPPGAFQGRSQRKRGNHAERTPSESEAVVEARLACPGRSFGCARRTPARSAPWPACPCVLQGRPGQAGCSTANESGMHPDRSRRSGPAPDGGRHQPQHHPKLGKREAVQAETLPYLCQKSQHACQPNHLAGGATVLPHTPPGQRQQT